MHEASGALQGKDTAGRQLGVAVVRGKQLGGAVGRQHGNTTDGQ